MDGFVFGLRRPRNGEKMLTREDIDNLFELLRVFRPNDQHLEQKYLRSAWLLALKPYNRDDVRDSIGAWFRQSKYWPEPSEIAALCPPLPIQERRKNAEKYALHRSKDPVWIRYDALVEKRRQAGIHATYEEAEKDGLSFEEWCSILDNRRLGFFD